MLFQLGIRLLKLKIRPPRHFNFYYHHHQRNVPLLTHLYYTFLILINKAEKQAITFRCVNSFKISLANVSL